MSKRHFEGYLDSFRRQTAAVADPMDWTPDEPGLVGVVRHATGRASLLVYGDAAAPRLRRLVRDGITGVVNVAEAARECRAIIRGDGGWSTKRVVLMASSDLSRTPAPRLPGGLRVGAVGLHESDQDENGAESSEVDLLRASDFVARADPTTESAHALASHLRALYPAPSLMAAVDEGGEVRATSGFRVIAADATILFVNTDPALRRRGIGRAMTSVALRAASDAGATAAGLEASDAGVAIYRSLGFADVGVATQFSRTAGPAADRTSRANACA